MNNKQKKTKYFKFEKKKVYDIKKMNNIETLILNIQNNTTIFNHDIWVYLL